MQSPPAAFVPDAFLMQAAMALEDLLQRNLLTVRPIPDFDWLAKQPVEDPLAQPVKQAGGRDCGSGRNEQTNDTDGGSTNASSCIMQDGRTGIPGHATDFAGGI